VGPVGWFEVEGAGRDVYLWMGSTDVGRDGEPPDSRRWFARASEYDWVFMICCCTVALGIGPLLAFEFL